MREEYEAWFIGKFGFPPMPIHSRVLDFCWAGYQAGRKNSESEIDRLKGMVDEIHAARKVVNQHDKMLIEIAGLRQKLETERMRLAACGVVALANTQDSAAKARDMHPEYRSASCDDVARSVDREMELRQKLAEAQA